jgi:hypothetical protein
VALLQLLAQLGVLAYQLLPLGLEEPVDAHRLRDHRSHDLEELQQPLELAVGLVGQLDR